MAEARSSTFYLIGTAVTVAMSLLPRARNNAGKHSCCQIKQFFESVGTENYWSRAYETWQNGAPRGPEGSVLSIILCGRYHGSQNAAVNSGLR